MEEKRKLKYSFRRGLSDASDGKLIILFDCQVGALSLDGLLYWDGWCFGIVQFVNDKKEFDFFEKEIPKMLANLRLPIGVVVSSEKRIITIEKDNEYPLFEEVDDNEIVHRTKEYCETVPSSLDVDLIKEELLKRFDEGPEFKRKKEVRPVFEESLQSLSWIERRCYIDYRAEDALFLKMLGMKEVDKICRYTSMDGLFKMIERRKQNMCSIVSMNDPNEIDYADSWMSWKTKLFRNKQIIEIDNSIYLLSCSDNDKLDDLTMWRLYGDDARGACLEYEIVYDGFFDNNCQRNRFFLAPVNYGESDKVHPELEFINHMQSEPLNKGWYFTFSRWYVWKYFFKSYNYSSEKEIRLIYLSNKGIKEERQWYKDQSNGIFNRMVLFPIANGGNTFPVKIKKIILGPKSPLKEKNREQIIYMLENCEIDCEEVIISDIKNYR